MHTADANSNVERPRGPAFTYPPGSRPLDGYVIKRGLGQGGFGEVYFAVSDAGKEVALKVVRRNLDVELRGVTQCLNLKHPNLVGLYDVRVDAEGNHWIVMEYVAGRRLVDVLPEYPHGMPLADALAWFRGIAAGTAYLHQSGIVHRDLKPANLFIENDVVKLGDYGLAKFISVSRRSGQTESVGTVHYMAPEIANGRYGKTIDIYALGVILYELTTGRVPFDGESVGEILMKHLTAEPDLAAVPAAVRPAVAAALAKDPELRPKTVDEFLAMVEGAAPQAGNGAQLRGAIGVAPRPIGGAESDVRPLEPTLPHPASSQRSPAWYAPSVVGVTAVCGMLIFALLRAMRLFYDGSVQPRVSWGIVGVAVLWLAAMSWLNRIRHRSVPAGRPHGPIVWGPPARGMSRAWFVVAGVVVVFVLAMFFSYSMHQPERVATPAVVMIEPGNRVEVAPRVPATPLPPTPSGAVPYAPGLPGEAVERVPGSYVPTPQEALSHEVTVMAPGLLIMIALVAGFGLWLYRARLLTSPGSFAMGAGESSVPAPVISRRANAAEFAASVAVALVATVVVGRIALLLRGGTTPIESVLWLAATSGAAATMLLVVERLFGSRPRDGWARRGPQALAGIPVGLASWWLARFLIIEFDRAEGLPQLVETAQWPECFAGGQPLLLAHVAYFGLVFFAAAWWRQTDRRRPARFQFSEVVLALLWAGVVNLFLPFPQPWGLLVAGTTATVAQFAAPWRDAGLEKAIAMRLRGRS